MIDDRRSKLEIASAVLDSPSSFRGRLLSVSQIFDLVFVHAKVMRDFMQHRQANLRAQFFRVRKIFEQRLGENRNLIW